MIDDRENAMQETGTPRWIAIAVVALAVVSLVALGAGWTAANRTSSLAQTMATQVHQIQQNQNIFTKRLAKVEDTDAQLVGDLSVITDKTKLTQSELVRARRETSRIKVEDAKHIADLQTSVNGELATKANMDDVNSLGTDVNGVKTDLEATKNNLSMTRGEFGTLIAKNHQEVETLRRLGERDYYEFTIHKKGKRERVGDIMVELRSVNPKKNLFTVSLYVDDQRFEKKNRSVDEPIYFFERGTRAPLEFTVNRAAKNMIAGYLSVPKESANTTAQATVN